MARLIDADFAQHIADCEMSIDEAGMVQYVLSHTPTVDAKPVVHGEMRVEITTDDFIDMNYAKENGCYRKHYFCPNCNTEIGHQTFDKYRMFGQGTIMKNNEIPHFCPNCGAKMDLERSKNV